MNEIQVLVDDPANRDALVALLEQHHTVNQSETVDDADLYVVDDHSLPDYRTALRQRQNAVAPAFCPVVLVRREATRISLPDPAETDTEQILIDEVVTAPIDAPVFFRRLSNLLRRRERDTARRKAEQRHRRVMDMLPIGVVEATRETGGEFRFVNQRFLEMMDLESEAELEPNGVTDLYADPEQRTALMQKLQNGERLENEEVVLETVDGDEFWASLTVYPFEQDGEKRQLAAIRDVSERREYREQLEATTDRLETLNRIVRHDIMNKLHVIGGTAEVLQEQLSGPLKSHLDRIVRSNDRAVELVEQMRNVMQTTLESEPDTAAVTLTDHLLPEIESARSAFPDAEIRLADTDTDVSVMAGELLHSVFRNLIRNAIKHNDSDHPIVTVTVERTRETVAVHIADNGPGIPSEIRSSLFERGQQGSESQGTGVGLYLVETLVTQYDGEVRVSDNDPTGTIFTVSLKQFQD